MIKGKENTKSTTKPQLNELLEVVGQHVAPTTPTPVQRGRAKLLLDALRRTAAFRHHQSFRVTVERLGERLAQRQAEEDKAAR